MWVLDDLWQSFSSVPVYVVGDLVWGWASTGGPRLKVSWGHTWRGTPSARARPGLLSFRLWLVTCMLRLVRGSRPFDYFWHLTRGPTFVGSGFDHVSDVSSGGWFQISGVSVLCLCVHWVWVQISGVPTLCLCVFWEWVQICGVPTGWLTVPLGVGPHPGVPVPNGRLSGQCENSWNGISRVERKVKTLSTHSPCEETYE